MYHEPEVFAALRDRDLIGLKLLVKDDCVNDYHPRSGLTLLYLACAFNSVEAVKLLLHNPNIDVNRGGIDREPPLLATSNIDIIKLLFVQPGFDPNRCNKHYMKTALYEACYFGNVELVKLLLSHPNIDCNQSECDGGNTPLIVTCRNISQLDRPTDYITIIKLLLAHPNINIYKKNFYNETAVDMCDSDNDNCQQVINIIKTHSV